MKSITDVFFEDCARFFTKLNRGDLGERAANLVASQVIMSRAFQLIDELLDGVGSNRKHPS